ncbi:hypothetical protein H0G86_007066 [Trichoderma simmonsii]|uniref:Uncharacterized protein n=1 Tax=Trichoderma simmonsii TaxID=1491479 RepID=A0A8G0LHR6_9HYPO|nr:hypothetical protein H0G86_007066 [Trichoderma simmonsii]
MGSPQQAQAQQSTAHPTRAQDTNNFSQTKLDRVSACKAQLEHRITRHETRPPAPESALATLQLLPRTEQITAVHRLDPRHRFPPSLLLVHIIPSFHTRIILYLHRHRARREPSPLFCLS